MHAITLHDAVFSTCAPHIELPRWTVGCAQPATNLPEDSDIKYWFTPYCMTEEQAGWDRSYGFGYGADEICGVPKDAQFTVCPGCGAVDDLTGVDFGGLRLIPQRTHVIGQHMDLSEPLNSMLLAESLDAEDTCTCSELLVNVYRGEDDDEDSVSYIQ